MITVRKLARLPDDTRRRKIVRLLMTLERVLEPPPPPPELAAERPPAPNARYWQDLLRLVAEDGGLSTALRGVAERSAGLLAVYDAGPRDAPAPAAPARDAAARDAAARAVNDLRHELQAVTGGEAADWDLLGPAGVRTEPSSPPSRGENALAGAALFLERIRSPFNLGAIARSAVSFGVTELILSPQTAAADHRRARRAAMGTLEALSLRVAELHAVGDARPIFALETGGTPIERFRFPADGVALVGSEELGLSPDALERADRSAGRVSIPAPGPKGSLNVAVAVGILLSWWQYAVRRATPEG